METDGIFTFTPVGFSAQLKNEVVHAQWDEVQSILAYKVDQMIMDCIVVEVELPSSVLQINEETAGFQTFMEQAAAHLPEFRKDWIVEVAFPAFQTNRTIIFDRNKTDGSSLGPEN